MILAPNTRIGIESVGTTLIKGSIPREGKLARGIDIAEEDGSNSLTSLRADEPSLYDGRHLVEPRQSSPIAGDVHIDQTRIHLQDGLDDLVLSVWQIVKQAVVTFAVLMIALVQTSDENDDISIFCLFHSLCREFGLRTGLIERTAYGDAVVALDGIANVATSII